MSNEGLVASALLKTNEKLYREIDGGLSWKTGLETRGARVALYRRYEDGDHDAKITDQMRAMLRLKPNAAKMTELCINYCGVIVDKMSGRLQVSEITSRDEASEDYISELLIRNDFDSIQGVIFRGAVRDADSYIMVNPDDASWSVEPAYDGYSGMVAIFGADDVPIWTCKMWSESDLDLTEEEPMTTTVMRLVVCQPGRISYWVGQSGGQEVDPVIVDQENKSNSIELNTKTIPVIHFSNQRDSYTQYGKSELKKAIPPQDVLNRTMYSMVMASEFSAFKVAWSIGLEMDKSGITPGAVLNLVITDKAGNTSTSLTPDQIEFLKACKVGEFGATDISQYTNQIEKVVAQICYTTSTPIYGVTTQGALSGDALRQLEIGLIDKCQRFQNENKSAIRRLIEVTADVQNAYDTGHGEAPELGDISVIWKSAEILNTTVEIASILAIREKAPGLFTDDFLRAKIGALWGMTQADILKESEAAKNAQSAGLSFLTGGAGNIPVV